MKKILSVLALSGLLVGCGTMSAQDQEHLYLSGLYDSYLAYCGSHSGNSGCTAVNKKQAKDAYSAANSAIDAFANGTIDQASMEALIQKAVKVFSDFQK